MYHLFTALLGRYSMPEFNAAHKEVMDKMLLADPNVRGGKMFGFPAYYAGGKLCVCIYGDGVGIKLPEESVERLLQTDPRAVPFQPMGRRKMREWVQINLPNSEGYREYKPVLEESVRFVLAQHDSPT
jgi:hypothetical protein